MANDIASTTWVLDTASATPVITTSIFIKKITWLGPNSAGHRLLLTDKDGHPIWDRYATATGNAGVYSDTQFGWKDGLILSVLGSGKVFIDVG